MAKTKFTAPGMSTNEGAAAADLLQDRLAALTDLQLTLKHVHWNVVGPYFIAVHRMLDPQAKGVRKMVDETAERIAALGASPKGTPGEVVAGRGEDDYPLGRADALQHLEELDRRYSSVIANHRQAMNKLEDIDLVSQDMLIAQLEKLEQYQWFVRAHHEDPSGALDGNERKGARAGRGAAQTGQPDTEMVEYVEELEPAGRGGGTSSGGSGRRH
jgi:starvation-inducible DNA-binding protein